MSVPLSNLETTYGRETGVVKRPGDFARKGEDGPPYVVAPDGATNKDGSPKRLLYSRPSSYGKLIENTTNLEKWTQRQLMLGIGTASELALAAQGLVGGDIESDDWRNLADGIITGARRAAKADLAADRGTHTHALVEDTLLGRDPALRHIAGELLDMPEDVQRSLVDVYHETIDANRLTILATEMSVVNDEFRTAGKLDSIARLSRPLRFRVHGGEIVTIDADDVICTDNKTGRLKRDWVKEDGPILWWQSYAPQVYLYASSVAYDTETDTRTPFPWPMSQQHALIVHLDNLAALDGNPKCELVYVDLATGRRGCEIVKAAKEFAKTRAMFSLAQVVETPAQVESVPVEVAGSALEPAPTEPTTWMGWALESAASVRPPVIDLTPAQEVVIAQELDIAVCVACGAAPATHAVDMLCEPCAAVSDALAAEQARREDAAIQAVADAGLPRRAAIQAKMDALKQFSVEAARQALGEMRMRDLATLKQSDQHSDNELDAIDLIVMQVAANCGVPFGPPFDVQTEPVTTFMPPTPKPHKFKATPRGIIQRYKADEGDMLDDNDAKAIAEAFMQSPEIVRSQCTTWKREAADAGFPSGLNELRSVRRFAITRAMLAAATLGAAVTDVGERAPLLRRALLIVTGEQFPANGDVPIGACLGALTVDEADRFCELSYELLNHVDRRRGSPMIPDELAARYRRAA